MCMKKFLWCFTVVFSVLSGLTAQTRIAILGDIERNRAETDMLTERFSKERNIALLERSEIDRIIAEQKLSLLSNSDAMKLGAMLGSRGMIIIKSFEWEGKNVLSARLVAAKSGAILGVWIQDTPSTEAFHFADGVKFSFMPLISKLFLDRKDITALSLLNIRASVDSPEAKELERKITLLLSQRLMYEKSFVVLERWRLSNIAWEKELNLDSNPFWTGSYILDGSLERTHDGKGTVKVVLRLRKPGEKEPTLMEVSGSTLDLKSFVEKMTVAVREKLGGTSGEAVSWDMKKEAEFYFNEAQWLLRAGAFERAREAADAAAALGKTGLEIDFIRIKSYMEELAKKDHNTARKQTIPRKNITLSEKLDKLFTALDIYINFAEARKRNSRKYDKQNWGLIGYELNKMTLNTIITSFLKPEDQELRKKAYLLRLLYKKFISLSVKDTSYEYIIAVEIIFDKPEDAVTEYKRILAKNASQKHYAILTSIRSIMQKHHGNLCVWNFPDGGGNIEEHEFFVDISEHFKQISEELEGTEKFQEQIDALLLAGNKASKEKISNIVWEFRDQILEGNGKAGVCPAILIESNQCPTETIMKLLMYAFAQDRIWNEAGINFLLNSYFRAYGYGRNNENKLKLAEAFYSYYGRIKDKIKNPFTETKRSLTLNSSFPREKKDINIETFCPSPVFSFKLAELFSKGITLEHNVKMNCYKGCLQISGASSKGNNHCSIYLIYCNEDDKHPNLAINENRATLPSLIKWEDTGRIFKTENDIYFFSDQGEIQALEKNGLWRKLGNTGFQGVRNVIFSGNMFFIAYQELVLAGNRENTLPSAIVQFDVKSGSMKILASSKRNPPISPLDNCPSWHIYEMACSNSGVFSSYVTGKSNFKGKGAIYEYNIAENKWKINKDILSSYGGGEDVFEMKKGNLQWVSLIPFEENACEYEECAFRKISLMTGNGEKVLKMTQLDENLFEIMAVDMDDEKFTGSKFGIEKKYFSKGPVFLHRFAVSGKRAYIILRSETFRDFNTSRV